MQLAWSRNSGAHSAPRAVRPSHCGEVASDWLEARVSGGFRAHRLYLIIMHYVFRIKFAGTPEKSQIKC